MFSASGSRSEDVERLFLWLSLFWLALYALRHYRQRSRRISTLPSLTPSTRPTSIELFRSPVSRVTLSNFHVQYQSTAWNALHQSTCARLGKRSDWRRVLELVYDIGSVLGVLGMIGSVLLLIWTTGQLAFRLYAHSPHMSAPEQSLNGGIRKRDFSEGEDVTVWEVNGGPALQLIIPGLTTPLHHLPLLLVALLITQVIHECGHAVAAALDLVPLTSAGLGVTVMLPSAFVAFPTDETAALAPRARVRLISAGAFHNLLLWFALGAAAWLRTSALVWPALGYRDVSRYGRVVVAVDEGSPLYGHLPVGAVIYKLGDEALAGRESAADRWEALISARPDRGAPGLGWCADEPWFTAQDASCCAERHRHSAGSSAVSCFTSLGEVHSERCVDPLRFLQPTEGVSVRRCASAAECGHGELCLRPRGDQELVTLTLHLPPWLRTGVDAERTVVWQGERAEIAEEVELGDWLPSYGWLPMRLPFVWGTLFSYLKMLTLSLYFFNLLPLPFLDGGQLFDVLYDSWAERGAGQGDAFPLSRMEEGEEAGAVAPNGGGGDEGGTIRVAGSKAHCRRGVHAGVGALMGLCVILSLADLCI